MARHAPPRPTRGSAAAAGSTPTSAEPPLGAVGIEEAARLVGVSPSAIRGWERQGLVAPLRTQGGARRYPPEAVERLRAIRAWRTIDGLNAPGIRRLLPSPATAGGDDGRGRSALDSPNHVPVASSPRGAPPISERLRAIRLRRGLTLRDAAERTGLSVSFISAVERGTSGASVSAIRRLLAGYGTTLAEILDAGDEVHGRRLVTASSRHAVVAGAGVRIENLADASRLLEPQLFVLAAGASSHGPYSHPGEEFMYVLDGMLGVWLDVPDEFYRLGPGDALTFPSTVEHRFQALGSGETRVIWVNTPPTF